MNDHPLHAVRDAIIWSDGKGFWLHALAEPQ